MSSNSSLCRLSSWLELCFTVHSKQGFTIIFALRPSTLFAHNETFSLAAGQWRHRRVQYREQFFCTKFLWQESTDTVIYFTSQRDCSLLKWKWQHLPPPFSVCDSLRNRERLFWFGNRLSNKLSNVISIIQPQKRMNVKRNIEIIYSKISINSILKCMHDFQACC